MKNRLAASYLALLLVVTTACAAPRRTPGAISNIKPGERPPVESDEAGLWMHMDRVERELRNSGRVVADPILNSFVRQIICRLTSDYCSDIRVYVVETPHFNASTAPNGVM